MYAPRRALAALHRATAVERDTAVGATLTRGFAVDVVAVAHPVAMKLDTQGASAELYNESDLSSGALVAAPPVADFILATGSRGVWSGARRVCGGCGL